MIRETVRRHQTLIFRALFLLLLGASCTVMLRYAIYKSPRARSKIIDKNRLDSGRSTITWSSAQQCDLDENLERYAVIFDAGSTGSRVHVYRYTKNMTAGRIDLHSEETYHSSPGLSSFDEPQDAVESLRPLLDFAMKKIPESHRNSCTPVWLKATAGLRLIGVEKAVDILNHVHKLFLTYPFYVPDNGVEMMDGKDEGPLAWLTVNFLLGNLNRPITTDMIAESPKPSTVGVVDMGGGSTQVVFHPIEPVNTLLYAPDSNTHILHYFGHEFALYQHSYLGFGLVQARNRIKKIMASRSNATSTEEILQVPCLPPGYLEEVKINEKSFDSSRGQAKGLKKGNSEDKVPIQGASHLYGFDQCMTVVYDALNKSHPCPSTSCSFNGIHQPTLEHAFKGDWYLMSKFYDMVVEYMKTAGRDHLTLDDYKKLSEDACTESVSEDESPNLCLDCTFLYVLLAHGYELPETQNLYPRNKINGFELSWTLGAMIEEIT